MAALRTEAAAAAAARIVTKPLYLVEINWSPVSRLSTLGDRVWAGHNWSGIARISVEGLRADAAASQSARLTLGNVDLAFGALVLSRVDDAAVRIWSAHADALADADPLLVFDGVIDSAEIDDKDVRLTLVGQRTRTASSPRLTIGPDAGFTVLLAPGTRIVAGSQTFVLER